MTAEGVRPQPGVSLLAALAVFLVLVLWLGTLHLRELMPSDEGRYAQIAREMAATGDWVTVRYNGLKYFEKPPFHLWMSALAFEVFGVGAWQARLWGAVSGLLAIAIMMAAAARWWGRAVGVATGWVLVAMPLWNLGSHFNSLDIGVSAALNVALGCFLIAQHPQAGAGSRRRWMLAVWAAMGVAVLTKGLMGLVLPGLVLVVYTLWSRDWALWARMHIGQGLAVFAAVTVPWFALVMMRNPEFAHFFFIHEHFQRYTSTVHQRHEPWWFFIPLMVAGFLPWSGLWRGLVGRVREAPRATSVFQPERLLATWVLAIFVFFSASGSKLPGYILPVMPALAVLGALALERLTDRGLVRHLWGMLAVAAALAAATPLVGRLGSEITPQPFFAQYAGWLAVAAAAVLCATVVSLWLAGAGCARSPWACMRPAGSLPRRWASWVTTPWGGAPRGCRWCLRCARCSRPTCRSTACAGSITRCRFTLGIGSRWLNMPMSLLSGSGRNPIGGCRHWRSSSIAGSMGPGHSPSWRPSPSMNCARRVCP
jgi:4-amino-4-deoxy-L-arabinose transferase-like glycosyltransferase